MNSLTEYSIGEFSNSEKDRTWIEFIKRLKDTGMPIKEIKETKHYARLRADGDSTLSKRMGMLIEHRHTLNKQIAQLQEHKMKLDEKIEYYQTIKEAIP